jgi:hypothetical protein
MHDILGDLPATRELPAARAETLRIAIERTARGSQPRRRPLTSPWFLVPAGVVGLALAVLLVVNAVLTPKPAYASWTAQPGALTSAETTELGARCAASVRGLFPLASADLRPVVGERRGTFQTALVASGPQVALCADWLGTADGGNIRGGNLSGLALDAALEPGEVLRTIAVPGQLTGPDAARIAFGLVSSDVAGVTVTTGDGKRVTASVESGYFLAWWPSGAEANLVEAFDSSGRVLAEQTHP